MEQMAASIQTVAGNAQDLATYVEETSTSITEMGASIEQVAKSSSSLASTVAEASATIQEMTVSTDQAVRNLEAVTDNVSDTSATVEEMTSSIEAVARNAGILSLAASRVNQTVSEMAGAVTRVAKIAEEADKISQLASEDARMGDEAVAKTVEGMKTISDTMENTARVITRTGGALAGDRQDRRADRGHRRPDEPAGPQRRHRGRPGREACVTSTRGGRQSVW